MAQSFIYKWSLKSLINNWVLKVKFLIFDQNCPLVISLSYSSVFCVVWLKIFPKIRSIWRSQACTVWTQQQFFKALHVTTWWTFQGLIGIFFRNQYHHIFTKCKHLFQKWWLKKTKQKNNTQKMDMVAN